MKAYTLVFILITLVASVFMSLCKKENKLSVAQYDFRDSLVCSIVVPSVLYQRVSSNLR